MQAWNPCIALLVASLGWSAAICAQPLICEIGGESVNPANGSTTAGKNGIMRCRDGDGRLQREQELRDGKFIGLQAFYERDGGKRVGNVNEKGNREGLQREYWPDGILKREEAMVDGTAIGIVRTFFASGRPQRVSHVAPRDDALAENAIEYHENGQLGRLSCASKNRLKETEVPCGFAGKAESSLHSARGEVIARETYDQGRLRQRLTLRNGKTTSSLEQTDTMRVERSYYPENDSVRQERHIGLDTDGRPSRLREGFDKEFAVSGQLVRETQWAAGLSMREAEWFLNGQRRLEIARASVLLEGEQWVQSTIRQYWDSGKPRIEEQRLSKGGAAPGRLAGFRRTFRENGTLQQEAEFHARGWRARVREFDEAGRMTSDEEFFEDGSRKSQSK